MSKAKTTFEQSILDAQELLQHFDAINVKPPPENAEVLKRAGLIMALTAWETYVEDRVSESMEIHLKLVTGSHLGNFMKRHLFNELKRFNNPDWAKTKHVFLEYTGVDVTEKWFWSNIDTETVKNTLNNLISKRGDAVHRSRQITGEANPHLVKREELKKAIEFLKKLVEATDKALED
ncbi:MAG: HEPN domain-containing protein [Armatimonadetes bacterium]|nr:HEPN domain-containing protein [Armatimonadota bacterium]